MSTPSSRLRPLFALALLATPLAACGGGGDDPPTGPDTTPTEIVAASPTTQTATVGTAVAQAPTVTVRNASGQGVAGVTVTFTVTAGGGSIGSASVQTNATGVASAGSWTLGATPGANAVTATAGTLTPVVFNATGQAGTTPTTNFLATQIAVGRLATCALRQGSGLFCWGTGFLGDGSGANDQRLDPVAVTVAGVTFTQVAIGAEHRCALNAAGGIYCWGSNSEGRVGDQSTTARPLPTPVAGGVTFEALSVGNAHSCAIRATVRTAYCWGFNGFGQLGITGGAASANQPTPVAGDLTFRAIAAGGNHSCGVTTGDVAYCWGSNAEGQLGTNNRTAAAAPTIVAAPGFAFSSITAGDAFTCALQASDGAAFCWGDNTHGQLGDNTTTDRLVPNNVQGNLKFTQIDAGDTYVCGVTTTGALYCWGQNASGQLGNGSNTSASTPQLVAPPAGQTWKSVSAAIAGQSVCATTNTNAAYCWGTNSGGLASGAATLNTPTAVRGS